MAYLCKTIINQKLLDVVKIANYTGGWLTVKDMSDASTLTRSQVDLGISQLKELGDYLPMHIVWGERVVPSAYSPKRTTKQISVSELELPTEHDPSQVIIEKMKENPNLITPALARFAMCSNHDVKATIKRLKEQGLVPKPKKKSKTNTESESELQTIKNSRLIDSLWLKPKK